MVYLLRHIPLIPQCLICSIRLEDIHHCLFTCTWGHAIWMELGLSQEIERVVCQDRSGSINLDRLIQMQSSVHNIPIAELALEVMWYIRRQRRIHTKGEIVQMSQQAAMTIRVLATKIYEQTLQISLLTSKTMYGSSLHWDLLK